MKFFTEQKKYTISRYLLLLVLMAGIFAVPGCKKDTCKKDTEEEPLVVNETLVSYSKILSYPVETIKQQLAVWQSPYPDAIAIVNNTAYGVDVYKITYNTMYKGEKVLASGLVCMPQSENTFPDNQFSEWHQYPQIRQPQHESDKLLLHPDGIYGRERVYNSISRLYRLRSISAIPSSLLRSGNH
jgi:hypothetical protein